MWTGSNVAGNLAGTLGSLDGTLKVRLHVQEHVLQRLSHRGREVTGFQGGADEQPLAALLRPVRAGKPLEYADQRGVRGTVTAQGVHTRLPPRGAVTLQGLREQGLLVAEGGVDGTAGQPEVERELFHSGVQVAAFAKQLDRRIKGVLYDKGFLSRHGVTFMEAGMLESCTRGGRNPR